MRLPTDELAGCEQSQHVLMERIADLTDEQARAPSRLADWSVGHVLTHLARNADSVTRRLEGAARGEVVDQYPGGYAGRAADIAAGATRPAAELIADVRSSAERMVAVWHALPPDAWERCTRDVSGAERPARTLVFRRWREVEVHHVDLGLGYSPAEWPPDLLAAWLPRELERLPVRTEVHALIAWACGRGPAPSLGPW